MSRETNLILTFSMSFDFSRWIGDASIVSPAIPLIFLFFYWKKQPRQNRILGISLCISLVFDIFCAILYFQKINNILYINLYNIIAFPAIMWFYHETLTKRSLKILVYIFTGVFLVASVIFALQKGLVVANNHTWMLSSLLITITSFFFVGDLNLMDSSRFLKNRFHETNAILNTSLVIYYFSTTIFFAMTDHIFSNFSLEDVRFFWSFHNAVHVLKNVGVTVAFYLTAKRYRAWIES